MLEKDKRRGLRRWRSFHAWMRRLQDDWWNHGTRHNPIGLYLHMKEAGVCTIQRGAGWGDRFYCPCFEFGNSGNYRFKNTPTGNESEAAYRKSDGWHDHREWETRNVQSDEMRGTRLCRRKREGTHPYRVCCRSCGFLIQIVQIENGSGYRGAWSARCERCAKKEKRITRVEDIKMPA